MFYFLLVSHHPFDAEPYSVLSQAADIANRLRIGVQFTFGGVVMQIDPDEELGNVIDRYRMRAGD